MGRYLANGIAATISIYSKTEMEECDIKPIKEKLSKYINLDLYDMKKYNDGLSFKLKLDVFNNNIHKTIKEISDLTSCEDYLLYNLFENYNEIDIYSDDFCQEKYPIELKRYVKTSERNFYLDDGDYYIGTEDDPRIRTIYNFYGEQYWLPKSESLKGRYKIQVGFILLWSDYDKYDGEDETKMLKILNTMKKSYYSSCNELTQNITYFVSG